MSRRTSAGDHLVAAMKKKYPPWRPRPDVLEQVKQYFLGFVHCRREIHPQREHIAEKLGLKLRTLDRYLHHLYEWGWIETARRTPRTAIRTVKASLPSAVGGAPGESVGESAGGPLGGPPGGSQKKENHEAPSWKRNLEAEAQKQHHQGDDVARPPSAIDASAEELDLLALAGVPRKPANIAHIRETVSAGVPMGHLRAAVCIALLRRIAAGNRSPVNAMKYFDGAVDEIVRVSGTTSSPQYFRHLENKLKRELGAQVAPVMPEDELA